MKRIITTSVLFILLLAITSCGEEQSPVSATTEEQTSTVSATQQSTDYQLPEKDYEGYTLNAGVYDDCRWANTLFDVQEEVGEVVNDAIYLRNRTIEEKYNVLIREIGYSDPAQIVNTMTKDFSADLHTFDLAFPSGGALSRLIAGGLVTDLNEVPHLNFENPWWDSGSVKDLSVGGKVYGVTGDIHLMSFEATWILTFNKKLIEDFNLENPYELVKQNKWTFDRFTEMLKAVSSDIDGNGAMNKDDMFGLSTHSSTYWGLFIASGERFYGKDGDDMPVLKPLSDRMNSVYEYVLRIMHNDNLTYDAFNVKDNKDLEYANMYTGDRALFFSEVMGVLSMDILRNMKSDYGLVPWPKYEEAQEGYYSFVHPDGAVMVIPSGVQDMDKVGLLAEALAYESYKVLRPAYYDTALRLKSTRDEESFDMLNLIFENRVYELGMIYGWGNLCNDFQTMGKANKNELASLYSKKEEKIAADVAKFVESISA
ncbi:MAG: extracellular solute-binding protein [Eubacteriales bacterium]